jgi:4-azaleucine resistance transporter AzlC
MPSTTKNASSERTRSDLAIAARENWVIWAGLFALGIGFGVLVASHGFAWWIAPLISATMFAGSAEFILVGMLAVGAPLAAIATTTFVVNSRHLFYGLSFPLHRVNGRLAKAYSVFALCDEAYALMTAKDPETLRSRRILWTQAGLHASWAVGALAGGVVGGTLLSGVKGLGFVLTALFVVLMMDAYRSRPDMRTMLLAVGCAVVAVLLAPKTMLLAAMSLLGLTLVARHAIDRRPCHAR